MLRTTWAVTAWTSRWTARGIGWAAPRVARGTAAYGRAVARPWVERTHLFAKHGRVPLVHDMTTGEWVPARQVQMDAPTGGDPDVRAQQTDALARQRHRDDAARARLGGGLTPRLSWWERLSMRAHHQDPDRWVRRSMQTRMAVAARHAERLTRAADRHWPDDPAPPATRPARPGDPPPIDLDNPSPTRKDPAMANGVRSFDDLHDPGIDPMEYPEQLPAHLAEVQKLVGDRAAEMEAEAADLDRQAQALRSYVEYMEGAEVDGDAMSSLLESAEAFEAAAGARRQLAEQVSASADLMSHAQRSADAQYGDQHVLRFDRAG